MRRLFLPVVCMMMTPAFADMAELNVAVDGVKVSCGGISGQLSHLKTMAGINTAITGVGVGVGAGALAVGLSKSAIDKEIESLEAKIQQAIQESDNKNYPEIHLDDVRVIRQKLNEIITAAETNPGDDIDAMAQELSEKTDKSVTLGNVRTGLMATNTATSIAGAVIAGTNQVKDGLESQIDKCILAVNKLRSVYMQERMAPGADNGIVVRSESIISACGAWETAVVDITSVNKRARGAAISSGIGAGVGLAGTITSGVANSESVRGATGDGAAQKEKKLNTASNVLAGGATVASATATVFNATQIAAVKRVVDVAEKCEEVLK